MPELVERCSRVQINRYIEPFVGSGALFFELAPRQAILADLNFELINFYRQLKRSPLALYNLICAIPANEASYYGIRSVDPNKLDRLTRASHFYYLNRFCFNGIYRTNSKGRFNVPYGRRTGAVPDYGTFRLARKSLKDTELICGDFEVCCESVRVGDFVYLDPPYDYTARRDRGEYGPTSFRTPDIHRLAECLHRIDASGGTFLLSYLDTPDIKPISKQWSFVKTSVKRQISAFADRRRPISELFISNSPRIVEAR